MNIRKMTKILWKRLWEIPFNLKEKLINLMIEKMISFKQVLKNKSII